MESSTVVDILVVCGNISPCLETAQAFTFTDVKYAYRYSKDII